MNHSVEQLDTRIQIVTPENIAFEYRVAGPFRRLPAFLIDLAIRMAIALLSSIVLTLVLGLIGLPGLGIGISLLLWFVLAWFYGGLFEWLWNGQTPGKRLFGLRVVSIEGQPITALQAILRNILREIDAQPIVFYQVGLLAASLNDRFQRLGDLACGTMVVVEEPRYLREVIRVAEPEAMRVAAAIPASFQPSRTMARTLAAYVERRRSFPAGRRIEIAGRLAEPLCRKFNLPPSVDLDLLLCGLYQRTFVADAHDDKGQRQPWNGEHKNGRSDAAIGMANIVVNVVENAVENAVENDATNGVMIEVASDENGNPNDAGATPWELAK